MEKLPSFDINKLIPKNVKGACPICDGKGKIGGCPKCKKVKEIFASTIDIVISNEEMNKLQIPPFYRTNRWESTILAEDKSEFFENPSFIRYMRELEAALEYLKKGGNFQKSVIVKAPVGFSKTTWAMSCIMTLAEHGYNLTPMITTSEMCRLLTLSSERPTLRERVLGYTCQDYLDSDTLFLLVSRGPEYCYAYETIINVCDIRSRVGKPTIIITDYSLEDLVRFDNQGRLLTYLRGVNNVDPFRYLTLVEFIPIGNRKDLVEEE